MEVTENTSYKCKLIDLFMSDFHLSDYVNLSLLFPLYCYLILSQMKIKTHLVHRLVDKLEL